MKKRTILIISIILVLSCVFLFSACSKGTFVYQGVVLGSGEIALKSFNKATVNVNLDTFGEYSFDGKYKIGKEDANGNKKVTITYINEEGETVEFLPMYIDKDGVLRIEGTIIKFEKK